MARRLVVPFVAGAALFATVATRARVMQRYSVDLAALATTDGAPAATSALVDVEVVCVST